MAGPGAVGESSGENDGASGWRSLAATGLLALLTACSGGGGGNNGSSTIQNNPDTSYLSHIAEPSAPAAAADWSGSQEYINSTGLAQLKAAEGYARRSGGLPGGQGVRIAVIDSGIDVTHPDLGNLAEHSWTAGGEALAADSHATFVAGIAAASRTQSGNPNDMHGMAYRATLVNFQASRPSVTQATGEISFSTNDLVDAVRTAAGLASGSSAVESDILNLSLGAYSTSDSTFDQLRTAMLSAAAADKIMVLAAGNEGLSGDPDRKLQPIYPAAYADDPGIAGHAIVVGNLTSTDQAAASSNHCGDTQDYCLFAPGTGVRSTLNGGTYGVGSGTSFAAPYVSGAAAVVKAAFPGVSNRDVVDRLLLTAEDLGPAGVDSTFGRGRLDLEAAMAPVGPTGLPMGTTVDGPHIPVQRTALRLGPGMVATAATKRRLQRAIVVDAMGFPFPAGLDGRVEPAPSDDGLAAFIGSGGPSAVSTGMGQARLSALVAGDYRAHGLAGKTAVSSLGKDASDRHVPLSFTADWGDGVTFSASLNGAPDARTDLTARLVERRVTQLRADRFLAPYDAPAGEAPYRLGISVQPAEGTEIALSASGLRDRGEGRAMASQRLDLAQRLHPMGGLPGDLELRLGLGLLQEEGGFLGGTASGAFGGETSSRSAVMTLSLLGSLTTHVDWFGTYSRGRSSVGLEDGTLLADWSDSQSEAFGLGLVLRDRFRSGDGLSLAVGQPLRQEKAEATVVLPVARMPDGAVVTAREKLDFAPEAREVMTEVGYRLPLGARDAQDIRAGAFLRLNPDHDPDRDPETGIGIVYRLRL